MVINKMRLAVVIPCLNEEQALRATASQVLSEINKLAESERISTDSVVVFVDDGSTDATWEIICDLQKGSDQIRGLKLSRNFGHQNAIIAGLFEAPGDAVVTMDADLQDNPAVLTAMIDAAYDGADVVSAVRENRESDSVFKRLTSGLFYSLANVIGIRLVPHSADFRLMSRRAIEELRQFKETNLFLRGLVPSLGFEQRLVYFSRSKRVAGESKYPFLKMVRFAWQGITAFSSAPLRLITFLGLFVSFFTFIVGLIMLAQTIFSGNVVPGWASTVLPIYFLGGLQLMSLGVIGEYIAKIYDEAKARPRFIVGQRVPPVTSSESEGG